MKSMKTSRPIFIESEYAHLEKIAVVKPTYMKISSVINETQKYYTNQDIDTEEAVAQHQALINLLQAEGVEVFELPPSPDLNEQVFTRDIGFAIGSTFFLSNMKESVRVPETESLKACLEEQGYNFIAPFGTSIEGGDVMVEGHNIFVGISGRTEKQSALNLQAHMPDYQVIPLYLSEDILHLDCVFNVISSNKAIIYREAFSQKDIEKLKLHFDLIEVSEEEQFYMAPNVLSFAPGKIISLPQHERLNNKLSLNGFEVKTLDFSEIIKSGGSFRCVTLPLTRY